VTDRPYSRVYHEIVDDPRFERVYGNDKALATWLRMLLIADAMYPASAPMTSRNPTVRLLIDSGLIEERPGNRYVIHGLQGERERRSAIGRNAVAVRWNNERTTNVIPAKQSKAEHSNGANAPENGTFMGYRKIPKSGAHEGQHPECAVCAPLRAVKS